MGIPIRSLNDREHRYDHDTFGDVSRVHYKEGIIRGFGMAAEDPAIPDDTCSVEVGDGLFSGVPFFYHCQKELEESRYLRGKSLSMGAWAFSYDDKVKVMFEEDNAIAILGHNDGRPPQPCGPLIRLQWHRAIGTGRAPAYKDPLIPTQPWWLNWFSFQETWHSMHYNCTKLEEKGALDTPLLDFAGHPVLLEAKQKHIFGMREQKYGTVIYYFGDWLIRAGPMAYIFMVFSAGMPAPLTGQVLMWADTWTPEKEAGWIANAKIKEQAYGTRGGGFTHINPNLLTLYPYEGMVLQTKFTKTLHDRFTVTHDEPQWRPKWILAEWWARGKSEKSAE